MVEMEKPFSGPSRGGRRRRMEGHSTSVRAHQRLGREHQRRYFAEEQEVQENERREFTSRKQLIGEAFLDFVAALKEKAVQRNFGSTYKERVRDQIIYGVANASVREKLLTHGESLPLVKAEEICRSLEALNRVNRAFGTENVRKVETSQQGAHLTWLDGRLLPGSRQDGRHLSRGSFGNRGDAHSLLNRPG